MRLTSICLSALFLFSVSAYAENAAPVYDVDSMSTDSVTMADKDRVVKVAPGSQAPMIGSSDQPMGSAEGQLTSAESSSSKADLQNRMSSMQNEIQSLRGQVEELMHQVQVLSNQQELLRNVPQTKHAAKNPVEPAMSPVPRDMDEETITPKTTLKTKSVTVPSSDKNNARTTAAKPASKKVEQPNNAEEQAAYQTAYNFIKAKKYNDAIATLQKMLIKYPSGQFAANAHYWLGELYSLTGENDQAASEFNAVIKNYPNNPRVADSELKLGLIYATQLKWPEAKTSFKRVASKYPGSASARLAAEQLKQLKQAGH